MPLSSTMLPLFSIALFCFGGAIGYYFFGGFIWGVGYAPTSYNVIDRAAGLLELKEGETLYDLGCGYGRVVFRIAQKFKANTVGIEADPVKCRWIKHQIKRKKLEGQVRLIQSDFLKVDLKEVENVFIFLSKATNIMNRLQEKAFREMKEGSRILSYAHRFDDWQPDKSLGELYLYTIPRKTQLPKKAA